MGKSFQTRRGFFNRVTAATGSSVKSLMTGEQRGWEVFREQISYGICRNSASNTARQV
ncbi:hypothetical protein CA54_42430 [Symmachiella macrocystis]|uniref:Uncharacterized protein n=1 Tax=Symmachiella macrocystis TaxID=2527985 RepID=A0A5C6BA85_9PLAN|nr:hypothetical protein CA54_42430 [Symmachiella macrocystis]